MTTQEATLLMVPEQRFKVTPGTNQLTRDFTIARVYKLAVARYDDGEESVITRLHLISAIKDGRVQAIAKEKEASSGEVKSVAGFSVRAVRGAARARVHDVEVQHTADLYGVQARRAPRTKLPLRRRGGGGSGQSG